MPDWEKLRNEYISTDISYRRLSKKYGVSESQLKLHGSREGWVELRNQVRAKSVPDVVNAAAKGKADMISRVYDVASRMLDKVVWGLEEASTAKEIRALTAALKDLRDVLGIKSEDDHAEQMARIEKLRRDTAVQETTGKSVTVMMEGELDEFAG